MHGHVLSMSVSELSEIEGVRQVTIQSALVNEDPGESCIVVVAQIRVTILKLLRPIRTRSMSDEVVLCLSTPGSRLKAFAHSV